MEWIIPMIAGLLLDICGGYMIVKPIIGYLRSKLELLEKQQEILSNEVSIYENDLDIYRKQEELLWIENEIKEAEDNIVEISLNKGIHYNDDEFEKKSSLETQHAWLSMDKDATQNTKKNVLEATEDNLKERKNNLKNKTFVLRKTIINERIQYNFVKWGFSFLAIGFGLIMYASIINYLYF